MIELAPGHKSGFPVSNPVLLAGGTIGYGEAIPHGLDVAQLGAVVVGPMTAAPRAGRLPPRLAETLGGFVLESGMQSRGVRNTIKRYANLWPGLGCPVIAQVVENRVERVAKVVNMVARTGGVAAIELAPRLEKPRELAALVQESQAATDLPVWAKVPLTGAEQWAKAAVDGGAVAIVAGQPARGTLLRSQHAWLAAARADGENREAEPGYVAVSGSLFGPLAFAEMLAALRAVARLALPAALIACGGIHSVEQARHAMAAGAAAVQIDSAVWVEPALPNWIAQALILASKEG